MREVLIRPTEKQLRFLRMNRKHNGYGGARGGGKSWVLRTKAILLANKYGRPDPWSEGIKIAIVRRTLVDVRNNHIIPMRIALLGLAKFNQAERTFYFPNGATIHFEYFDHEGDETHFQGVEYDVIFIDEATQMREDWLKKIAASCRGANSFPHRIYYTCNPGGEGHAYIKRIFIDRQYRDGEDPNDYDFVQAKVTDNTVLMEMDPDYLTFLKNLPPKIRSAWLDGSWDVYSGMFFESWVNDPDHYDDRVWTHVINPITVRKHWQITRSFDWGYRRPFSCGYYTIDDDGMMYRIAELYGVQKSGGESLPNEGLKWAPERVFAEIQRMEREHPLLAGREIYGVADPAIWDAEHGVSIAETAMKYGLFFEKGDHQRIPGWMQCQYRLQFDEDGRPGFQVFRSCTEFIRTLPTLQYDEHRAEDLDSSGEDHAADEWRYYAMRHQITPHIDVDPELPAWGADPLNQR